MVRRLAHEPFGWRPTSLHVTVRRYRCSECRHVWRQDTSRAAEPRAKLSRRGLRWTLEALVVQHLTIARVADRLGVSFEDFKAANAEQIAVRRVGEPDDVANAVAFFADPAAGFVSGQVLYVAGGPTV